MSTDEIRLKRDGIKEAVCELRFEAGVDADRVVNRLRDAQSWRDDQQFRLPTAEIPVQLRQSDPQLRHQPTYEIRSVARSAFIRVGPNSLSCHQPEPYTGWGTFGPLVTLAINAIFEVLQPVDVTRIGLRYINALNRGDHLIEKVSDMNISIQAGDAPVSDSFALNYRRMPSADHACQVSIATPDYITAPPGEGFAIIVDVDVFTPDGALYSDADRASAWVKDAHVLLKEAFFGLWPKATLDKARQL